MSREIPPPLALTLLILLRRAGWSQEEIAARLKVKPETVSTWIRTGRGLDRARLEEIAVVLGFKEGEIDRTLDYLAGKQPAEVEEIPGYTGLTPDERRIVQEARARVQQQAVAELDAALPQHILDTRVRRARAKAEEVWNELRPRSAEERRVYLDENPEVCTPALVRRLCDESVKAAGRSAGRAMSLAELALYAAERVPGEVSLRCRGFAKGFIANAFRVGGQLHAADSVMAEAFTLWRSGLGSDPALSEARLLGLKASLRRNQRRFQEAFSILGEALTLNDPSESINLLLERSHLQYTKGEHQQALDTLQDAQARIEPKHAPQLWFAIQFNRAANLSKLGRYQDAQKLLPLIWDQATSQQGDLHILRLRWLAAGITAGLGDAGLAVRSLQDVKKGFADLEIPFDAALVSLELAEIYLKQERWGDLRLVAEEMLQLFRDLGVHREAIASLLLFREAVEREDATVDLIQRLARYLREAERDPSHRFDPKGFPPL
jgi:tetratricopeptide (TPR) repeat protein